MVKVGKVYFVGAGSGNPEYLTVKASKLLKHAEVVAYDDLVHPSILELAPADAELLPIGYRAFERRPGEHPLSREVLDRLRNGKDVIRLKSGDPLVFGRTFEEIEGLEPFDIPYEIVPGISAIFGAAASFGIPLTHRNMASGINISAGNHATLKGACRETLVIYMPRRKLGELCESLLKEGYPPSTPACFIQSASTPLERKFQGTIANLCQRVQTMSEELPGLVIIGDVVGFAKKTRKPSASPWAGRRLVVARKEPGHSQLGSMLMRSGADVVNLPLMKYSETLKNSDQTPVLISKAIKLTAPTPEAILIPNSRAAKELLKHTYGFDFADLPFFVMGEKSAEVIREAGFRHIILSKTQGYEGLLEALEDYLVAKNNGFSNSALDQEQVL